jgi:hypothetical protein
MHSLIRTIAPQNRDIFSYTPDYAYVTSAVLFIIIIELKELFSEIFCCF